MTTEAFALPYYLILKKWERYRKVRLKCILGKTRQIQLLCTFASDWPHFLAYKILLSAQPSSYKDTNRAVVWSHSFWISVHLVCAYHAVSLAKESHSPIRIELVLILQMKLAVDISREILQQISTSKKGTMSMEDSSQLLTTIVSRPAVCNRSQLLKSWMAAIRQFYEPCRLFSKPEKA